MSSHKMNIEPINQSSLSGKYSTGSQGLVLFCLEMVTLITGAGFSFLRRNFKKGGGGCVNRGLGDGEVVGGCGACKYVFLPSLRLHEGASSIHISEHRRVTFQLVASES